MISQDTMDYLLKRQINLVNDQHTFEQMRKENRDDDDASIIYSDEIIETMIGETVARRNELALLITCNTITDEHRGMTQREKDEYFDPLAGEHDPR